MNWGELAADLNNAKHGETEAVLAPYRAMTGKSISALYSIAKKHGYESGRKSRADKGTLKCELSEYQLTFISSLMQSTARQVKGVIMPVEKALEIAIDNGVIKRRQVSVSRLQTILRERSMNKKALDSDTASIRMKSLHPNHVHIFDASICIQYYLKQGKGLGIIDERDFRETKPKNMAKLKQRLLRMVLTDHYSGTIFVKYYVAPGESSEVTLDFLTSAWRGLGLEKYPFRGVPQYLLMDAGSANIAKKIMAFIKALDIETPDNLPHNPRRQGSAEVTQNIVERQFECTLGLEPAYSIEELNEWVQDWQIHYNATQVHSRHGRTRTQAWLDIRQEQLLELPSREVLQMIVGEPIFDRTVAQDNTISVENRSYNLKHITGIFPKQKVQVRRRPFLIDRLSVIYNNEEYIVKPIATDLAGFREDAAVIGAEFKAQPETPAEKARKRNTEQAYGEEQKKGDLPYAGTLIVHGNQADKVKAIPIPKRSTPMNVDRDIVAQNISIMEHLKKLRDRVGSVSPELNKEFREEFGTSICVKISEQIIKDIEAGRNWREQLPDADQVVAQ